MPPIVGRPTDDSVTLNLVAGKLPVEVAVHLESSREAVVEASIDARGARDLVLDGLRPGTEYRYTVEVRGDDYERTESLGGRFVTRRPPGSAFTFALVSDTHLPAPAPEWTDPATAELFLPEIYDYLSARLEIGTTIGKVVARIRERRPDFIVSLGDMVHFYRGFNDPFPTAESADLAYLDLRAHLGQATAEAAFFAVVGNWDGESGWHPERLRRHALEARTRYLPNPGASTYPQGGSPREDYFAWRWGDALLVTLNVATYTPTAHTLSDDDDGTATDWTLGDEQLAWLESTLAASDAAFELILIHHPVGGNGGDELQSAYGRGGGRAARVGEQARIHQLMVEHGVEIFFYGHDHVFTDMVVDGIHYTLPGSAGAPWKFSAEETGYENFDDRSGFALVHVESETVEVELVGMDGIVFRSYSASAN
ncbi:MAG: hypothetical protein GY719_21280 [bacterium]|nr:hypothetical protein [bacterium]